MLTDEEHGQEFWLEEGADGELWTAGWQMLLEAGCCSLPKSFQVMLMTDAKIHQAPHDAVLSFVSIVPASIAACCLGMQAGLRQPPPLKPPPASVESLGCDSGRRRLELE